MRHASYHVALSEISGLVATNPHPPKLLQKACECVVSHTDSTGSYFAMIGQSSREISVVAAAGVPTIFFQRLKMSVDQHELGGHRMVGLVYRSAAPVKSNDCLNDSRFEQQRELLLLSNIRSKVGIPVFVGSECRGVLVLTSGHAGHYSDVLLGLLRKMAKILAVGLDRAEQRTRSARYQALYTIQSEVNRLVARGPEPQDLYEETCRIVTKTSGLLRADIHVPESGAQCLWLVASAGRGLDKRLMRMRKQMPLSTSAVDPSGQGIAGTTFRSGRTTHWANVEAEQEFEPRTILRHRTATRSLLGVPIVVEGGCRALLVLASTEPDFFDEELVGISEQVAESLAVAIRAHEQRHLLRQMALTDPLTGLPNRSLFFHDLSAAMSHVDREGGQLAVVLINLDAFHEINARLGRRAGDDVLRAVASRLASVQHDSDTLALLGGDEFAVLLPRCHDEAYPDAVLSAIFSAFDCAFQVGTEELIVRASAGVSVYPDHGPTTEDLMRHADLALHRARSTGGGTWARFTQTLEEEFSIQSRLKARFLNAVRQGEIVFHYQPVVELQGGCVVGAEALARWEDPRVGLLLPEQWIDFVEESPQLISALGRHALSAGLQQLNVWHTAGNRLWLAVNIGVHHFLSDSFFDDLREALAHAPHLAAHLVIEITETALIDDFRKVSAVLAQCRTLGVHIALDDFGTGRASLLYLQELPADHLKIDRIFVGRMLSNLRAFGIVRASAQITQMLDMDAIAEGVETERDGLRLLQLGYKFAQGFAIAPPMTAPTFEEWQRRWTVPPAWRTEELPHLTAEQAEILASLILHRERFQQLLDVAESGGNLDSIAFSRRHSCPAQVDNVVRTGDDAGRCNVAHTDREVHECETKCVEQLREIGALAPELVELLGRRLRAYEKVVEDALDRPRHDKATVVSAATMR